MAPAISHSVQRAAEAIYSPEGKEQVKANIDYYLENARIMREGLKKSGMTVFGGINSPYLWLKTPEGTGSWKFFDTLLEKAHVVGTPGVGFGPSGEGFLRLTAFGKREDCIEAIQLQSVLVLYVFSRRRDCSDVVPLFSYTDCSCFILLYIFLFHPYSYR